jgi:hypothetical protein
MIYPPLEKTLRIKMKQVNAVKTRRVNLSMRLSVGFSIGHHCYVKNIKGLGSPHQKNFRSDWEINIHVQEVCEMHIFTPY